MVKVRESRECVASGKIVHLTEQDAMRAVVKMGKKFHCYMLHYYCKQCSHWHISRIKRMKKRR